MNNTRLLTKTAVLLSLGCGLALLVMASPPALGQTKTSTSLESETVDVSLVDPGDADPEWAAAATASATPTGLSTGSAGPTTASFGGGEQLGSGSSGDYFNIIRKTLDMTEEAEELPVPAYQFVDVEGAIKDDPADCPGGINNLVVATSGDDCMLRPQMTFTDGYLDTAGTVISPNTTKYNGQTSLLVFGYVGDIVELTVRNKMPEAVDGTAIATGFYAPADNLQTVHWHGMELDNESDGTPISEFGLETGTQRLYRYRLYRPGMYWFHPHIVPLLTESRGQVARLVIRDHSEDILALHNILPVQYRAFQLSDSTVANDTNKFLLRNGVLFQHFSDFEVDNNLMPNISPDLNGDGMCDRGVQPADCIVNEGELVFVNGVVPTSDYDIPTIYVPQKRGVRVAFNDASNERFYRFRLLLDGEEPPFGPAERVNRSTTGQCYAPGSTVKFSGADPLSCDQGLPLYRVGGQNGLLDNVRLEGQPEIPPVPPGDPFVRRDFDTVIRTGEDFLGPSMRTEFVVVTKDRDGNWLNVGDEMFIWVIDYPHGRFSPFFDNNIGNGDSNNRDISPRKVVRIKVVPNPFGLLPEFNIAEGDPLLAHPLVNRPTENLKILAATSLSPVPAAPDPQILGAFFQGSEDEHIMLGNHLANGDRFPSINNVQGQYTGAGPNGDQLPTQGATRYAHIGDVVEFAYANDTGNAHHPFHMHGFSFQPISIHEFDTQDPDGDGIEEIILGDEVFHYDYNEFVDVIPMQPGKAVKFRMKMNDRFKIPDEAEFTSSELRTNFPYDESATYGGPGDIPNPYAEFGGGVGRWLFHCHILHHAGLGMISDLCVAPESDPDASTCKIATSSTVYVPIP